MRILHGHLSAVERLNALPRALQHRGLGGAPGVWNAQRHTDQSGIVVGVDYDEGGAVFDAEEEQRRRRAGNVPLGEKLLESVPVSPSHIDGRTDRQAGRAADFSPAAFVDCNWLKLPKSLFEWAACLRVYAQTAADVT